jgi:hypothetical protein
MATWKASAKAAGLKYICQPSTQPTIDAIDPNLIAFLQPWDEPDDLWVNGQTTIVAQLIAEFQMLQKAAPRIPVVMNIDLSQTEWQKPPYAQIEPTFADFQGRLAYQKQLAGGRRTLLCLECSNQQLSKQYFPAGMGPTGAQMNQEVQLAIAAGTSDFVFFPQQTAGQGNGFQYDATTTDTQSAILTITGANDLLNGSTLTTSSDTRLKDALWHVVDTDGRVGTWEQCLLAVLMDIRDELKLVNQVLQCHNTKDIPRKLERIARNAAKIKSAVEHGWKK